MSTFSENHIPINDLYQSISKWIERDLYYEYFKRVCDDFDSSTKPLINHNDWEKFPGRFWLQIHERLKFTDELLKDSDTPLKKIFVPPLVIYLRLTCFDKLGQPHEWMPFNDWLKSNTKKKERQQIIESIKEDDKIEYAKCLFKEYQKIYGTKNSFFIFLRQLLPETTKKELLSYIKITRQDSLDYDDHEFKDIKERYLFDMRNNYTHNIYSRYFTLADKDGEEFSYRETIRKNGIQYSVYTHKDFLNKLKQVVLIGIAQKIKVLSIS